MAEQLTFDQLMDIFFNYGVSDLNKDEDTTISNDESESLDDSYDRAMKILG